MDEIVVRAMQKWPNVPRVYGWLRLDRRGGWWIRGKTPAAKGEPAFERVVNPAIVDFIGRNYGVDEEGRCFFQNGPQRVFVRLDYTPWVCRLGAQGLATHVGGPFAATALHFDEQGAVVAHGTSGVGVLDDRDLAPLLERLTTDNPDWDDTRLTALVEGSSTGTARLFGRPITLSPIRAAEVPGRFGFNADPRPAPGEPEC